MRISVLKKHKIIVKIILLILAFLLVGFYFSKNHLIYEQYLAGGHSIPVEKINTIEECLWKGALDYINVNRNPEFIDAYDNPEIKKDTLYLFGQPKAKAIRLFQRDYDYVLIIQYFGEKEYSRYIGKCTPENYKHSRFHLEEKLFMACSFLLLIVVCCIWRWVNKA
jgi:hypothetical protein